jgi:hypothetical protein
MDVFPGQQPISFNGRVQFRMLTESGSQQFDKQGI